MTQSSAQERGRDGDPGHEAEDTLTWTWRAGRPRACEAGPRPPASRSQRGHGGSCHSPAPTCPSVSWAREAGSPVKWGFQEELPHLQVARSLLWRLCNPTAPGVADGGAKRKPAPSLRRVTLVALTDKTRCRRQRSVLFGPGTQPRTWLLSVETGQRAVYEQGRWGPRAGVTVTLLSPASWGTTPLDSHASVSL